MKIPKTLKIITFTFVVNFISIFVHSANADTEDFESNIGVGPRSVISEGTIMGDFELYGWRRFFQSGTNAIYPNSSYLGSTDTGANSTTKIKTRNGDDILLKSLTAELELDLDGNSCNSTETITFYGLRDDTLVYSSAAESLSDNVLRLD